MQLEELTIIKVTAPNKKRRSANDYWSLEKMPELREAIEQCISDGKETYFVDWKHMSLFHVQPRFPLIESAMKEPENQSFLKVSVGVFHPAFNLGVRDVTK